MSDEKIELSGEADYRFLSLVMSLATAAWSQLGKVAHPVTQKIEKDVDQARMSIEFLRMLQEKTEGNLSVKVADLELNFADEVRKSESSTAGSPAAAEAMAGKPAEASAKVGPDIIIPSGAGGKSPEIIKP